MAKIKKSNKKGDAHKKKSHSVKSEKKPKVKAKIRQKHEILYKNIDWATETATYFGFAPFMVPEVTALDKTKAVKIEKEEKDSGHGNLPFFNLSQRVSILRDYFEKKWDKEPHPILVSYNHPNKTDSKTFKFDLEIMETTKSIADATIIKTAYEILKEAGFKDLSVSVNSIGDKESFTKFFREFYNYCKKNLENINSSCRQDFKKNVLCLLSCDHEKCKKVMEDAPKPMNFLSEQSRIHFKEVLEHIETLGIPYEIDNSLVAERTFGCQTVFKITNKNEEGEKTLASGVRYNTLAKKIGFKRDLPSIGAKIEIKDFNNKGMISRKVEKPLVFFVQIGFEAKMKSLLVVEMLREAKIPSYHSLSKDKLSSQLSIAENMKIPYTIIMGQKEAVENSVIVRDMSNRSQETIKIETLTDYLKKVLK